MLSSGMCRRVVLVGTDVSDEHVASIGSTQCAAVTS
jgi:hypothetical protein